MGYGRNKNKIIVLAILLSVVTLSVGFAAFSSSLRIKSKLSVNPSDSTFSVVFTSMETLINDEIVTDDISPEKYGTNSSSIEATNAKINNSGTYPTISNLSATLSESGQRVTYTVYPRNIGKHNAYLTSIVFQELSSGNFIDCSPIGGTDATKVTQACEGIDVNVQVINQSATTLNVNSTTLGINNHILYIDNSEQVIITLSYNSDVLVDGPFEVTIGDIYLTYGTQMTSESPTLPRAICKLTDADGDNVADPAEMITCGEEKFYILKNNTTTVDVLAEKNITIDLINPRQSDSAGTIAFGNAYWAEEDDSCEYSGLYTLSSDYSDGYVYDENSDIYPYVEAYETYLKSMGVSSADAKLMNIEQIPSLPSDCYDEEYGDYLEECVEEHAEKYSWVYSPDNYYWTGTVDYFECVEDLSVRVVQDGETMQYLTNDSYYIRPVVTISVDELG